MKAVIHAGRQPQRDEPPISMRLHQRGIAEQIEQRIRRALDLKQFAVGDDAERADDGIGRADHDRRIGIRRTQAGLELARKTIMQALEVGLARLGKIEIGKQPPAGDREIADQGLLDLAEPAHEPGQGRPRDTIGQQEVQVFLLGQSGDQASNCHESVSGID